MKLQAVAIIQATFDIMNYRTFPISHAGQRGQPGVRWAPSYTVETADKHNVYKHNSL